MSDTALPEIGAIIDGRYELLSVLGEGGFGIVYKARQTSTGQNVAVKLLHAAKIGSSADGDAEVARFEREMQLIAQLKHPNIVRLIDTGALGPGQMYTVLEYIEGVELSQLLRESGALKPSVAKSLMFQVLDALSVAHKAGVVHRDLKPQNIMVTTSGYRQNAMVLDFGISAIMEEARSDDYQTLTMAGRIHGTPAYMAPEQLRAKAPIPQTDIYAWGLVFLEALNGRRAVVGETLADIIASQISLQPVLIPDALMQHPLGPVIAKATAKNLDLRYKNAEEALRALDATQFNVEHSLPWTGRQASDEIILSSSMSGQFQQNVSSPSGGFGVPSGPSGAFHEQHTIAANMPGAYGVPLNHPLAQLHSTSMPMPAQGGGANIGIIIAIVMGLLVVVGGVVAALVLTSGDDKDDKKQEKPAAAAKEKTAEPTKAPETTPPPIEEPVKPSYEDGKAYSFEGLKGGEVIFAEGDKFTMGSESFESMLALCRDTMPVNPDKICTEQLFADQTPAHEARVGSFFVDKLEVSNAQYHACVEAGGCKDLDLRRCALISNKGAFEMHEEATDEQLAGVAKALGADALPVVCVNQGEAQSFCSWAGKRLPSEDEWEFVASNNGAHIFPWGDQSEAGGARANGADLTLVDTMRWKKPVIAFRSGKENADQQPFVAPVGSFPAGKSKRGIEDLAGNVREWVSGAYVGYDGKKDLANSVGRGGGWADTGPWLSARARHKMPPQTRRGDLGFRCALSLDDVPASE